MSYDLTAFLTTVAASSASIVAILGGFIASKLITISGERDALLVKLNSIEEELRYKSAELDNRRKENDICDAISFIRDHVEAVSRQDRIDVVYDTTENNGISKERIEPYWNKALSICRDLIEISPKSSNLNSDGLPKELAGEYSNDTFSYEVLLILVRYAKKVAKEQERMQREAVRKSNPFASMFIPSIDMDIFDSIEPTSSSLNYSHNEQEIARLTSDIGFLEFQRGQLEEQRKVLAQPKGMKAGLSIFVIFAITCIITPLAMSPRYTESLLTFWIIKTIILALFIFGLVAIFVYLAYLLRWKNNPYQMEND